MACLKAHWDYKSVQVPGAFWELGEGGLRIGGGSVGGRVHMTECVSVRVYVGVWIVGGYRT